ncbi:hypothetical protein H4Q26_006146 [Puccinia striiformis f. sp. tritici PST-130]|nr:hypothetical protein Pst134EB_024843 [Puccinia striiformis f. sp. tritici]KAI9606610.1 hypothetical protein H4Q26_006146 [Puccinia striiformis f. sp. tritici PST-130]
MSDKNYNRLRFPYKKSFNSFSSVVSRHSLAEVATPTASEKGSESPKKNKTRSRKHRGGKKNAWSPSHYVPNSFTLSLDSISPKTPSSRAYRRWSSKPAPSEPTRGMSSNKYHDSNSFKHQAKGVFRKILLCAKRALLPSKTKLTRKSSVSSWRAKSRHASEDPAGTRKPKISYPMKLVNSDLSFVATQDPWEPSVRPSGLHRRATVGTAQSKSRSLSCTESRFSSGQPSQEGTRQSFSVQQRVTKDSISKRNTHLKLRQEAVISLNRRPQSAGQVKLSSEDSHSKRSQNYSFPPNRGSLYRHPPTRPLSLSNQGRRNSILIAGDENSKMSNIEGGSRRTSMISSSLTSTTNHPRQSWTTGRAVLDTSPTPQGSSISCAERASIVTNGTDQKSLCSYRRPARNDWAGVIEEDITLTLMGCSPPTSRASPVAAVKSTSSPTGRPFPIAAVKATPPPTNFPTAVVKSTPPPSATSSVSSRGRASPVSVTRSTSPPMSTSPSSSPPIIAHHIPCPVLALSLPSPEDRPLEILPLEDASAIHASADRYPSSMSPSTSSRSPSASVSATPTFVASSPTPTCVETSPTPPRVASSPTPPRVASSPTPPREASSPTPPSTPSPPASIRSIPLAELHRPLSLLFQSMGPCQLDGINNEAKRGSDWYAELMNTVEQSISKLN